MEHSIGQHDADVRTPGRNVGVEQNKIKILWLGWMLESWFGPEFAGSMVGHSSAEQP